MNDIASHLLIAAERIIGSERHKLVNDSNFIRAVAIAYEAIGFGATNDQILRHAEAVFAGMQANSVPSAEPVPLKQLISQTDINEARAAAERQGVKDGAIAERIRIGAILSNPLATNRMDAAKHLAFTTDMEPDAAIALLHTVDPFSTFPSSKDFQQNSLRACNAQGGLVTYEALTESVTTFQSEYVSSASALLCAVEATSDPYASVRTSPEQKNKARWKSITDELNTKANHAIHV